MCPNFKCDKRVTCYRYMAVPNGRRQSYMLGRGFEGEECNKYSEVDGSLSVSGDDITLIDKNNKDLIKNWQGFDVN